MNYVELNRIRKSLFSNKPPVIHGWMMFLFMVVSYFSAIIVLSAIIRLFLPDK